MGTLLKRYDPVSAMGLRPITTSDTADQDPVYAFRGFHVGVAGDVAFIDLEGNSTVAPACVAGYPYAYGVKRFLTTGTTATSIKGII